jgi:lupus La protein
MADTETTAAPTTNLAEVSKTESAVEVTTETTESKPETTDSKPEEKATKTDDGEEKWALNGKSEDKNDRRDTHNARSGRDNRGRGNFKNNFKNNHKNDRRKTCAHCSSFCLPVLTICRDNHEFDNLPESDDPDEIRSQV